MQMLPRHSLIRKLSINLSNDQISVTLYIFYLTVLELNNLILVSDNVYFVYSKILTSLDQLLQ